MKHVKLFEQHLLENERQDISLKITDVRNSISDLQQSIADMGRDDNPNPIKISIAQLKMQKQNLKNQMLQLDLKILAFKEKLD
jgi:hypothetical protein